MHSQLAAQSLLPRPLPLTSGGTDGVEAGVNILSTRLAEQPPRLAIDICSLIPTNERPDIFARRLRLFNVDMPADGSLQFSASLRYRSPLPGASVSLYLKIGKELVLAPICANTCTLQAPVLGPAPADRLEEIGVCVDAPHVGEELITVLEITALCVRPKSPADYACNIADVRLESRGTGHGHWRLCWSWACDQPPQFGLPYSEITGPMAFFVVEVAGGWAGRAYAAEFALAQHLVDLLAQDATTVRVTGIGFDGCTLATASAEIQLPPD